MPVVSIAISLDGGGSTYPRVAVRRTRGLCWWCGAVLR
jgi:hypothetical protein